MTEPDQDVGWRPRLTGVIHLPALPGSPRWDVKAGMQGVIATALKDARAFQRGGADSLCIENFGDVPFFPDAVPAETVAAMAVVAAEVLREVELPMGFNVLRCDARAALGLALAAGGRFVRVNVHTGARVTDQGLLQGQAHQTMRLRNALGGKVQVWADVDVKHSAPLAARDICEEAVETVGRGLADALIVSGAATGAAVDRDQVMRIREACPGVPLYLGSGTDPESLPLLLLHVDGAIVGTWAKRGGRVEAPVEESRVRQLADILVGCSDSKLSG